MSNQEFGAGFRIVGTVKKTWISGSGNFARITIEVPHDRGQKQIDVRSFGKDGLMEAIRGLRNGQKVQVTGEIDTEVLKNGAEEVMINGYRKWVTALTARKIDAEPIKKMTVDKSPDSDPLGDDKVGW